MMRHRDALTKFLAIVGTVLVWFPVLAPILLTTLHWLLERRFLFDYLMPAELFLSAWVGGGLLLWAAWRARSRRGLIGACLGAAVGFLVGSQALAVVTGLASGATEPTGWQWVVVLVMLTLYALALVVMGVGGILLLRDLRAAPGDQAPAAL